MDFTQNAIVKSQFVMFMLGTVAKEPSWLKCAAMLPGHKPSVKFPEPKYLQKEKHQQSYN